ncbi:hypothetical protein BO79DRAFT_207345 [Aspergillus costaricaensis CBS 115574]|uniref:Uncharacterized protein n=1 Tax=Aspergillus costaricaensis CBS 115574 TaxID=1448317 RepID=A0ACD1IP44_9EURO|nr:hypothetical protein BO79DRAFT_207345 [Aspergillus costaricaensis CBS 115574]RAK92189.1 hypothetical protein BO79DRAFT_207345 [Aspergillus costaricaensis CBS 115574]
MAPRPILYPLKTSKSVTFPSQLQDNAPHRSDMDQHEPGSGPLVPPPRAYMEFLRALRPAYSGPEGINGSYTRWVRSRALPSPVSMPPTARSATFPPGSVPKSSPTSIPPTPRGPPRSAREPISARHLRASPQYPYSPATTESPQSPFTLRTPFSPADWRGRYIESSSDSNGRTITIQHIVTHTVNLKRAPSLEPPPRGKRRRTNESQER